MLSTSIWSVVINHIFLLLLFLKVDTDIIQKLEENKTFKITTNGDAIR